MLSQYYLDIKNISPQKFLKNYMDLHQISGPPVCKYGYGYNIQTEQWTKGLYTDWNVSKTIILQPTTEEGEKDIVLTPRI